MPAEVFAAGAEVFVLLIQALLELMLAAIQLGLLVIEIIGHLIAAAFSRTKEEESPRFTEKVRVSFNKRFGAHTAAPGITAEEKLPYWNPYSSKATPAFHWKRWHTIALTIVLTLIALLALSIALLWGKRFDLVVSEQEVQEAVAKRFPFSKTVLKTIEVTLENPKVLLHDKQDHLAASIEARLAITGVPLAATGSIQVTGRLEYRPNEAAFYLQDIQIVKMEVRGIPQRWEEKAREGMSLVTREVLKTIPVYWLKDKVWKERAAKLVLKKVRVERGQLVLTMGIGE